MTLLHADELHTSGYTRQSLAASLQSCILAQSGVHRLYSLTTRDEWRACSVDVRKTQKGTSKSIARMVVAQHKTVLQNMR